VLCQSPGKIIVYEYILHVVRLDILARRTWLA